jgi:hypothetical protein
LLLLYEANNTTTVISVLLLLLQQLLLAVAVAGAPQVGASLAPLVATPQGMAWPHVPNVEQGQHQPSQHQVCC